MRTLRNHINNRALEHPDKTFLFAPEPKLELTYRKLKEDCEVLGKFLLDQGLQKGDKVSFMLNNGYQTVELFLGIMYAGFVVSPINLIAHPAQVAYVLEHSDARIVFVSREYLSALEAAIKASGKDIKVFVINVDDRDLFFKEKDCTDLALPEVTGEDPALLLYTSGTTGTPKGVLLTHKNVISGGEFTTLAHQLAQEDRALCSLPLYHINGEIVTTLAPLISGGSVVMPHKFSVSSFWELISAYRCTWFSVVPTIISYLLHISDSGMNAKKYHLEQVRFGRSASSPLPPSLHRAFEEKFNINIVETMGLTETAAPVFSNPLKKELQKHGSPGVAVGNKAKVVNPDTFAELPPGQIGEIWVKGDNVMKEYYKAPDITGKTLINGWLRTGDLGYRDQDGFYFITGRIKELIIKGGENIAPREIDDVLYKHPKVMDAVAFGVPDEVFGQEIMACVVVKPEAECTEDEIYRYCLQELGEFKTPRRIFFAKDLPKGPSGKIQRLKIAQEITHANS